MSCGACTALAELGRHGALPLANESPDKRATTKLSIIENLISKVQSTKESTSMKVYYVIEIVCAICKPIFNYCNTPLGILISLLRINILKWHDLAIHCNLNQYYLPAFY